MSNTVIEPMYKLDKVNSYTNPSNMNLALVYRGFYKRNGIHKTNNFNADIFKNRTLIEKMITNLLLVILLVLLL